MGPMTEPCGTPLVIVPIKLPNKDLKTSVEEVATNNFRGVPTMPRFSSLFVKILILCKVIENGIHDFNC